MGRPHRTDFPGAIHHVIARCDNREPWALEEADFAVLHFFLERAARRFNWRVLAFCLMTNHYHLLVQCPDGGLTKGVFLLNRGFAGWFNHKYHRVGHVFQDRYIAILVQDDLHLVRCFRYILRNPVAARMVGEPSGWKWSSARAVVGRASAPDWVDWEPVVTLLGGPDRLLAFLHTGDDDELAAHELHHSQVRPPLELLEVTLDNRASIARAHYLYQHRVADIAEHLGVSPNTVYRALHTQAERARARS
jgi:REP element-mobilizing transposase RayT